MTTERLKLHYLTNAKRFPLRTKSKGKNICLSEPLMYRQSVQENFKTKLVGHISNTFQYWKWKKCILLQRNTRIDVVFRSIKVEAMGFIKKDHYKQTFVKIIQRPDLRLCLRGRNYRSWYRRSARLRRRDALRCAEVYLVTSWITATIIVLPTKCLPFGPWTTCSGCHPANESRKLVSMLYPLEERHVLSYIQRGEQFRRKQDMMVITNITLFFHHLSAK